MEPISMIPRATEIQLTRYVFDILAISADTWIWLDPKDKLELLIMAAKELDIPVNTYRGM